MLKSKAKLKKLIATEIEADAEKYGDERRTKHRRARGRAGDRRVELDHERAGDRGALERRLGALPRRATRSTSRALHVQDRRRLPRARRAAAACSRRCSSTAPGAPTALAAHSLPSARGLRRAAVRSPRSAGRRQFARRHDRRARGSVAARERRRLRLHRAAQGAAPSRRPARRCCSVPRGRTVRAGRAGRRRRRRAGSRSRRARASCSCSRSRRCPSCRAARATRFSPCPARTASSLAAVCVLAPEQGLRIDSGTRHMVDQARRSRALRGRARTPWLGAAARLADGGSAQRA